MFSVYVGQFKELEECEAQACLVTNASSYTWFVATMHVAELWVRVCVYVFGYVWVSICACVCVWVCMCDCGTKMRPVLALILFQPHACLHVNRFQR